MTRPTKHAAFAWLMVGAALALLAGCSLTAPPPPPGSGLPPAPVPAPDPATRQPPSGETYVQVSSLNLRQCPARDCRIVTVLRQGQKVGMVGEQAGWAEVELGDGRRGWVAARYLGPTPNRGPSSGGQRLEPAETPAKPPALREEFAAPSAPPPPQEEFAR